MEIWVSIFYDRRISRIEKDCPTTVQTSSTYTQVRWIEFIPQSDNFH
jgi:hypothetical protein